MPLIPRALFESRPLLFRLLLRAAAVASSLVVLYLGIAYVAIPLHVWLSPVLNPTLYELGLYGGSPSQTFVSNGLTAPRVSVRKYDDSCEKTYTFLTYNGASVPHPGPAILDADNELVWKAENYGVSTNLKVQTYQGEQYLTFWSGQKGGTMGRGVYHMVSFCYFPPQI